MEYKKSFTYTLKQPVGVSVNGKVIEAQSVEVFAPIHFVFKDVNVIDVEYHKSRNEAIKQASEALKHISKEQIDIIKAASEEKTEIKPETIISEMIRNGADLNKCLIALKNILTATLQKPMCFIDIVPIPSSVFDNLSVVDTKALLGLYIINFLDISQNT
jgi:chlorite dismutase